MTNYSNVFIQEQKLKHQIAMAVAERDSSNLYNPSTEHIPNIGIFVIRFNR